MEQHLRHFMTKISANILRSFPVEVTPYLDLISYLHPRMDSHHCPFTITPLTMKARSSLAIKHHKCCFTNPPTCSNLVSVTFYEHLKYELFGGSLPSKTASSPAPLPASPSVPQALSCPWLPRPHRAPTGQVMLQAKLAPTGITVKLNQIQLK